MNSSKFNGFTELELHKMNVKNKLGTREAVKQKIPTHQTPINQIKDENDNSSSPRITIEQPEKELTQQPSLVKQEETTGNGENNVPILEINTHPLENGLPTFRGLSLKEFEHQRQLMEEQNKQKREMLQRAISKYAQKTATDAKKLQEIQTELSKLDSELAEDVAILRKQIELASINYMTSQKQYEKIESAFLKAKLDLHNSHEKKELLTEHLHTIIAHNEDRKAKKLSELMEKVGLSLDEC